MTWFVALNETGVNLEMNSSLSGSKLGRMSLTGPRQLSISGVSKCCFCFFPHKCVWELKISERFWYQGWEKNGKKNHDNFKRWKLLLHTFYKGMGRWRHWSLFILLTVAEIWIQDSLAWDGLLSTSHGWASRSSRQGLPAALLRVLPRACPATCSLLFLFLNQAPVTWSAFLSSRASITLPWFSAPNLRYTMSCGLPNSLLPPYSPRQALNFRYALKVSLQVSIRTQRGGWQK